MALFRWPLAAAPPQTGPLGSVCDSLRPYFWVWVIAAGVIVPAPWISTPNITFSGSAYLRAIGIGLVSITFVLASSIWRQRPLDLRRLPTVLLGCLGVRLFLDAFMKWKAAIPQVLPFTWDDRLQAADRWLHGGILPWKLLVPILGGGQALRALDHAYYLWFPIMAGVVLWQLWRPEARFWLAFVLIWLVLGVLLAGAMSSAGPIFVDKDVSDHVRRFPELESVRVADRLWAAHLSGGGSSIAAMPSLHVAMPALWACATRGWRRTAFATYTFIILLGSVMLGWHYAIDGYAGIAGAILLWSIAGRITANASTPDASRRLRTEDFAI